jgi:hypothetical protein
VTDSNRRSFLKHTAAASVGAAAWAWTGAINAAVRLGRSLKLDTKAEQVLGDDEANRLLTRTYRQGGHWSVPRHN